MALIKVKVLKPFEFEDKKYKVGEEVVVQRKPATPFIHDGTIQQVGEVLDRAREADKPLVEAWEAEHQVEEIVAPEGEKEA